MSTLTNKPNTAIENVTGRRVAISSEIVGPVRFRRDEPKSSCTASPSQSPYRSRTGRSSPSCFRTSSTRAGVASAPPARVTAASPGTSSVSMNTTNETIRRTGMRLTSRRRIRASMKGTPSRISTGRI